MMINLSSYQIFGLPYRTVIGNVFIKSPVGVVYCGKRHPAGVFPNL